TVQSVEPTQEFAPGMLPISELWFLRGEENTEVRLNGYLNIRHMFRHSSQSIRIQMLNNDNVVVATIANFISRDLNGVPQTIPFDIIYNISAGERLFLISRMGGDLEGELILPELVIEEGEIFITNSLI